ncbi:Cilia- and flagella-associated protein 298 [Coccomyxa sp. Obi]|nr:Cilia- and flagella-associated protein 298 [Coccomyxa sp. Obi]
MVLLVVKRSESQQFLYEIAADTDVEEVLKRVVNINNLRFRIQRLKQEGEKLAVHAQGDQPTSGDDKHDEHMEKLRRAMAAAELLQHKNQVAKKVALTEDMLQEAVEDIRRAAAEAYPEGLPTEEPFKHALDGTDDPTGTSHDGDDIDASEAELWFASKRLPVGTKLSQHVGRNEKTKAVVKLQHAGYGPPPREPVVDEETQKAMLAYYHKKQEDEKRLAADDTMYFDSAWANPRSLKNQFSGVGNVRLS